MGSLRYWIPNAITSIGIVFAALSIQCSIDGHYRSAAWWAMYCLLTDNIDGLAARRLRATSAFGAQLDSFSDFLSFGVAPAVLFYAFFTQAPGAGWSSPGARALLSAIVLFHVICVAGRLARFNVTHDIPGAKGFFFGWPTTYIGGSLAALFAFDIKYGDPAWSASDPGWDHWMVLGDLRLDGAMRLLPWLMPPGGLAMISTLRMPRVGRTGHLWLDVLMFGNIFLGYLSGLFRHLPEYMTVAVVTYFIAAVRYHLVSMASPALREIHLPPLFSDDKHEEPK